MCCCSPRPTRSGSPRWCSTARYAKRDPGTPDYPWAPRRRRRANASSGASATGARARLRSTLWAPSVADDDRVHARGGSRTCGSAPARRRPRASCAMIAARSTSATSCRRSACPTLVLHRTGDRAHRRRRRPLPGRAHPGRAVRRAARRRPPPLASATPTRSLDEVEEFLTGARHARRADRVLATVLFTDIVGSTERAAELGDRALARRCSSSTTTARPRASSARFRGREVEDDRRRVPGDLRRPGARDPLRLRDRRRRPGRSASRSAPACTPASASCVGDDIGGIAVHIGARVARQAGPGEVLVSSTVKDLVAGSGIEFSDRGVHELKGVPGTWRILRVEPPG